MNYKNTLTFKAFKKSKYFSLKYINYFPIYDELLKKFRNKIVFVEIESFRVDHYYGEIFGKKQKLLVLILTQILKDLKNMDLKYQSEIKVAINFGKFSTNMEKLMLSDDGGHTNYQQIITVNNCIPNRMGGILIMRMCIRAI